LNNTSYWLDLHLNADSPQIEYNTIDNNLNYWIYIKWWTSNISHNDIINNVYNWIYLTWGEPIITNNLIEHSQYWIKISTTWKWDITWNTIQNNTVFWISSDNLHIWEEWKTTSTSNIFSNNIYWNIVSTWMWIIEDITIDWTVNDIIISWWGQLLPWKTLTIKPWSVLKFKWDWKAYIQWKLIAEWTELEPIIFTSINDNSVWQALWSWSPETDDWKWIILENSWSNESILDYTKISYAKWNLWLYVWISIK
jgi:hypothetical protein